MGAYSLQVPSEMAALTDVFAWLETICGDRLSRSHFQQLEVIIAEAFSNTVKYAHGELAPTTLIHLELDLNPQQVEVRVWDQGQPFDFGGQLQRELQRIHSVHPLHQNGHRGLLLMKQLSDDLVYRSVDRRGNCLVIRKTLNSEAVPSP